MNRLFYVCSILLVVAFLSFIGCSSSQETQQQEKEATGQQQEVKSAPAVTGNSDTIDVNKQAPLPTEQPRLEQVTSQTEQKITIPQTGSGNYAVQIGAFKMNEKAEEIANAARNRFQVNVKTFLDKETGLTKVLVGSFGSKDEARAFRDQIAKQFVEDYKDAWVTELPKE